MPDAVNTPDTNTEEVVIEKIEEQPPEQTEEEKLKAFYTNVDADTKVILDLLSGKDIEHVVGVLARFVDVVGEASNISKLKLLEATASVINKTYPDQHPLIKIVTKNAGLQAGVNFDNDILSIVKNADDNESYETEATVYNITKQIWTSNFHKIPEDKLEIIAKFYNENYGKYKEEIITNAKRNNDEVAKQEADELKEGIEEESTS